MIKREELTNPNSCMSRAKDDELVFVLLGRDAATPHGIRAWAAERIRLGKNKPDDPQILSALADAQSLDGLTDFRSPAPTPPLDVEAEKRITEIRERESKATKGPWFWRKCYEIGRRHWAIKSPESEADGRVVGVMGTLAFDDFTPPDKWHADPNNQFIAHARLDIPFLLEQISLLRRHIASPAQPEKRDEWVSVDERLPELHKDPLEVQVMFRDGSILNNAIRQTDGDWFWNGKFFSEFDIIQWRVPAPPQSGKEGQ